jgi:hypothetical protein
MLEDISANQNQVKPSPWIPGETYSVADISNPDFTRASAAFSHGTSIGVNTPRFASGGLLFERSVANLALRSSEFDNVYWTKNGVSASTGVIIAPDGTMSAEKITEDSATGVIHVVDRTQSLTINTAYTNSVYAKVGERFWLRLSNGTAGNNSFANFNLNTGSVGSKNNAINATIEDVGNGWYRCSYSFIASATASAGQRFNLMDSDSAASVGAGVLYNGDGISGLYLWGAQFEVSDCVTSYIPTTTASVTRNVEYLRVPNYGLINKTSGAAIVRAYVSPEKANLSVTPGATTMTLLRLHGGLASDGAPTTNLINIDYTTSSATPLRASLTPLSVAGTSTSTTGIIVPGWYNVGIRWENGNLDLWLNGSKVGASAAMNPSDYNEFTTIVLGGRGTTSTANTAWTDVISHFNLYDAAPSTGQMAALTAPGSIPTGGIYALDLSGNSIKYATSGVYTSEWFNSGVSGCVYSASGAMVAPTGTTVTREYRTANADNQSDAGAWSMTIGTGKYVQYRVIYGRNTTALLADVPYSAGTTITPANYGKAIMLEGGITNLLTSPLAPATQSVTVTPGSNYALRFDGTDISSGSVLIEHVGVETTTADFGTGTLSNVQASGNVLTLAIAKADPTFARATVATLPNELTQVGSGVVRYASGAISDGVTNKLQRSQEFNNAYWSIAAGALTSGHKAPDGSMTAYKLFEDSNTTRHYLWTTGNSLIAAIPTTYSVYAKAAEVSGIELANLTGGTTESVIFDLSSGVIYNIGALAASATMIPAGDGWYRCSMSVVSPVGQRFVVRTINPSVNGTNATYAGNPASGVLIWGAQAEDGLTGSSTYIPTTSAAAARSSLLGDRSIMIEESSSNIAFYSQEFDNAYWSKTRSTVTSNATTAPDGTSTADKLVCDTGVATTHVMTKLALMTVGAAGIFSIYAKYVDALIPKINLSFDGATTQYASFDISSGTVGAVVGVVASITPVGDGWYRCSITAASVVDGRINIYLASSTTTSFTGDGTSGIFLWGAQAELKDYATSYIPTTSVTVTRNAENVTIPAGAIPTASGTIIVRAFIPADLKGSTAVRSGQLFDCGTTSTRNRVTLFRDSSPNQWALSIWNDASATSTSIVSAASAANILVTGWNTFVARWSASRMDVYCNGVPFTTPATGSINVPLTSTAMQVGRNVAGSAHLNNLVSAFVIYNEYMSDSEAAYYSQTGIMIPLDHRTTYSLRFQDNLLHGEGGYRITPVKALEQIGTITGSNVSWNADGGFGTPEDITWVSGSNVTITGNSIQKTSGTNNVYDAGAIGSKTFGYGSNFYASHVVNTITGSQIRSFGLSNDYSLNPANFDYNWGINPASSASVYENSAGAILATVPITIGSVLSIAVSNNVVRYYHNGTMVYTSLIEPVWPLSVMAALYNSSTLVSGAITGPFAGVSIDSSIDNGSTWYPASQSGAITGLSSEVPASGKNLLIRQKLITPTSAATPKLGDITIQIAQKQTKSKNELVIPVYNSVKFTPTGASKWQFQTGAASSSFQTDGTVRSSETLSIPSSGLINGASGSVICRVYHDPAIYNSTILKTGYVFSVGTGSDMISMLVVNGVLRASKYGQGNNGYGSRSLAAYGEGWHTYGMTWSGGVVTLWIDGTLIASDTTGNPTGMVTPIYIGASYINTLRYDLPVASVDLFNEPLDNSTMNLYTAASGYVIPITSKHTYQLKFEDNLEYGMAGTYLSRVMDSQVPNAKWATYKKQDVVPAGASITYMFCASNDIAGPFDTYTTDITAITGRYIKVKIICMSSDVNNFNPQVLDNTVRVYPKSV